MDFSFIEDEAKRAEAEVSYKKSLDDAIKGAVEKEVVGLKTKNEELILEKKSVADKLAEYLEKTEGIDIDKAKEAMVLFEKTKRKDLLEEGKLDEYIAAKVQDKEREIENLFKSQLEVTNQEKENIAKEAVKYSGLYRNKIIEDSLRSVAMKSGCTPNAEIIADIVSRGKGVFKLDASETAIEAKNSDGTFKKTADGDKILTPEAWMDDLKRQCPYYFPASTATGAGGGGGGGSTGSKADSEALASKIQDALKSGDMKLYRKLRNQQGAAFHVK